MTLREWRDALLMVVSIFAIIMLVLQGLERIRDWLVDNGVFPATRRLGKFLGQMTATKRKNKIAPLLREIGFTGDHFKAIRAALDQRRMRSVGGASLEWKLFEALRPRIIEPSEPYIRVGRTCKFFIDTMGLRYETGTAPNLAHLLAEWLLSLQRQAVIPEIDCLLANKDGNSRMVEEVCQILSPSGLIAPIVCKGEHDPSRVAVPELDFEGLNAFMMSNAERVEKAKSDASYNFRVTAVDDNCTSGQSLCSAITRFNEVVRKNNLPFNTVSDAVTLFVIDSPDTERFFRGASAQLHSVLSLGDDEIRQIRDETTDRLMKQLSIFQLGFACKYSRNQLHFTAGIGN